jgi:hypothetical protein
MRERRNDPSIQPRKLRSMRPMDAANFPHLEKQCLHESWLRSTLRHG